MGFYEETGAATVSIPFFKGLMQYGDGIGIDPCCAKQCTNAMTESGCLRPMAECEMMPPSLPGPIETLARLHRRWYAGSQPHDVLIAACKGHLYWMHPEGTNWNEIPMPDGVSAYQKNEWSCVTYEKKGGNAPVDVLLMSNDKDGMIAVEGNTMTVSIVHTPKKFGVIARHAERIWGGAIENDPDMLVYSAPYDPFTWPNGLTDPTPDGPGDVLQPSWDGDSFTALTPFGSQLIALKRTHVWRILGINPGEYAFKEQYGGGTPYAKTVAVDGARIFMLGLGGILCYDGESVTGFDPEAAADVFARANRSALHQAVACMYRGAYYCALALDDSLTNNAVLRYDTEEKTWLLREGISVESFLPTENALFFTSSETPGRLWTWKEDVWAGGRAAPMTWITPWCDLGVKNVQKGGFQVYLTVECTKPVRLTVAIETEKKKKSKSLLFQPPKIGRQCKQKRIAFGGSGRRFRLILASDGQEAWRIVGGVQIEAETDAD